MTIELARTIFKVYVLGLKSRKEMPLHSPIGWSMYAVDKGIIDIVDRALMHVYIAKNYTFEQRWDSTWKQAKDILSKILDKHTLSIQECEECGYPYDDGEDTMWCPDCMAHDCSKEVVIINEAEYYDAYQAKLDRSEMIVA